MVYYLINRVVESGHRVFVDTRGVWAQYHIIQYIENAERFRYPLHRVPIYYITTRSDIVPRPSYTRDLNIMTVHIQRAPVRGVHNAPISIYIYYNDIRVYSKHITSASFGVKQ